MIKYFWIFMLPATLLFFTCRKHDCPKPVVINNTAIIQFNQVPQTFILSLQPDSAVGKDAAIWFIQDQTTDHGATNTTNYGNDMEFTSMEWTFTGSPGTLQSLVQFDLSSIPVNAKITSALLSLYHCDQCIDTTNALSGPNPALLQRVTSPWLEHTVTWDTQPSVTTQNQVVLPASTTNQPDYTNINITTLVQDMVTNPTTSFGFLFSQQNQSYYRSLIFASSDHPESALHPKIVIEYTLNI